MCGCHSGSFACSGDESTGGTLQVVISIFRFITDGGDRSIDLRGEGARYQAREQFHKCPTHQLVAPDAKGGDTETFEPVR